MKFAVVVFPGSNSDYDAFYAASRVVGEQAELVWHKDTDLKGADAVILPGGFAHGDYLRTGAIARFSPIMAAVKTFADRGGPVLGICNGFQVLLEAGLLPGAMVRNDRIKFVSQIVPVRVEQTDTPFTAACAGQQVLRVARRHGDETRSERSAHGPGRGVGTGEHDLGDHAVVVENRLVCADGRLGDDAGSRGERGDREGHPRGGRFHATPHRVDQRADEGRGAHFHEAEEQLDDQFTHGSTLSERCQPHGATTAAHSTPRRSSRLREIVTASAYCRSAPNGRPRAIEVIVATFGPSRSWR